MEDQGILQGVIWKFMERLGVFSTQFVVQIILARILAPSDYGTLSIMLVFTTVSNVIIQSGFNAGLIQRKDVSENDYSTVLWISLGIALVLYVLIFCMAPFLSAVYQLPALTKPLRVIAVGMFPGAINSIQIAKVSKEFDFKKLFYSNISGIFVSGMIGISIALHGGGIWALVAQNIMNLLISCCVMYFMVRIKFRFFIDLRRLKIFLAYGWKLIVSGVLNTVSEQLNGLIIGYKYTTETLGFYTRGMQFPNYGITIVEGTMTGVLLPSLSKVQDDKMSRKKVMKSALSLSTYIVFPLMAGLAAASEHLVMLVLSDKWIGCVGYLKIFCVVYALYPVHICNLQALNSVGRSDLYLAIEIIKKIYTLSLSVLMLLLFDTPMAIAIGALALSPVGWFVNAYPNKKIMGYGFWEQLKNLFPNMALSVSMYMMLEWINFLDIGYATIIIQMLVGVVYYIAVSKIFKLKQIEIFRSLASNALHKCLNSNKIERGKK